MNLGESVRTAREVKKMTQGELAEKSGLSRATINYLEKNKINISIKKLGRVLEELGKTIKIVNIKND